MRPCLSVDVIEARIRVRSARVEEAEALARLHVTTWQEAYAGLLPDEYLSSLVPSQRLPMWQQLLRSPDRVAIFVAENMGAPIGFSSGGISNDEDAPSTTGELWSIYLLRDFWNQGIGRHLHDQLMQELVSRGYKEATLWVMEANERTRRWYERRGWTEENRRTIEIWGANVPEVRYRRPLEVKSV